MERAGRKKTIALSDTTKYFKECPLNLYVIAIAVDDYGSRTIAQEAYRT